MRCVAAVLILSFLSYIHASNATSSSATATLGTTSCSAYNTYSQVVVSGVTYPSCRSAEGTNYTMCCGTSTGYPTTQMPTASGKCAAPPYGSSSNTCPTGYELLCQEVNITSGVVTGETVACKNCDGGCYSYSSTGSKCQTKSTCDALAALASILLTVLIICLVICCCGGLAAFCFCFGGLALCGFAGGAAIASASGPTQPPPSQQYAVPAAMPQHTPPPASHAAPPPPPGPALPPGWQEAKDPTGKVYFYNAATNQTSWDRPGDYTKSV